MSRSQTGHQAAESDFGAKRTDLAGEWVLWPLLAAALSDGASLLIWGWRNHEVSLILRNHASGWTGINARPTRETEGGSSSIRRGRSSTPFGGLALEARPAGPLCWSLA